MSDAVMKRVEELILAAAPAYETYLLQMMGKVFRLKLPFFKTNSETFKVKFESEVGPMSGGKKPEKLVMWIELNRAMGTSTVSTEYWQDTEAAEPTARGEARVDATSENLMAPDFAFGWLHKLVGGWSEGIEGDDMADIEDTRMEQAEQLILKADEILGELGYAIEATSYESYADTLDNFLLHERLDEQVEGILSKVGKVVRKAAHAYGAAKGGVAGLKARWGAFKGSVKAAYKRGHDRGYKGGRGGSDDGEKTKTTKSGGDSGGDSGGGDAPAKGKGKPKLKLVRGKKGDRHPGGKMKDTEYKARYGKTRMASSVDDPSEDPLDEMMGALRDTFFESEFNSLDVKGLLVLEKMVALDEDSEAFKELAKALRSVVRDPAALATWVSRQKQGDSEPALALSRKEAPEQDAAAVSAYQKLSGLVTPMQGWSLPKLKQS